MEKRILLLLQRPGSPLKGLVSQALAVEAGCQVLARTGPPLPAQAFFPQALVLWDLNGFAQPEICQTAAELRAGSAGAVILCSAWEESWWPALRGAPALEFLLGPFSPKDLAGALEAAWFLKERLRQLEAQGRRLAQQLKNRRIIDQAKKVLMQYKNLSEAEALRRLQHYSRNTNQKLVLVAENLLAGHKILAPQMNFYRKP